MELTSAAPPTQTEPAPRRPVRRRWLLLNLLMIIAAGVAPSLLLSQRVVQWFSVGPTLLSASGTEVGAGGRFGPLNVRRGHFYRLYFQAEGTAEFIVRLDAQDGKWSKNYEPSHSFEGNLYTLAPILRAPGDDPAATFVVDARPGADPAALRVRRLEVREIRVAFYVWRALVHLASLCAFLTGMSILSRQSYARWMNPSGGQSPGDARRVARWAVILLTAATGFGLYTLQDRHAALFQEVPKPSIYGWDGSFYYFWLRSAMVEGDLDFAKDLRYCNSLPLSIREDTVQHSPRTRLGLLPNKYPVGWALSSLPWYLAADLLARAAGVPRDGWGPLYQAFLVLGQVVYAALGLWLAFRVFAGWVSAACAAAGVALGWLCSPLAFYQTIAVSMAHNLLFFGVICAYAAALDLRKNPDRLRPWLLVGICCALTILARYQGAVMLLFPGVVCLQAVWAAPRRWSLLVAGVAASAVPLAVQAFAWKTLYGSFFLYTYEGEGFDWTHPHLWESLFSPFHGLFNWHPALLVGFVGFAGWAVTTPRRTEAVCFTLSLLLTIYVNSAWQCWWFGSAFGGRAYEACVLFAMLGFGWIFGALARWPKALHLFAAAGLLAALWSMNLLWLSSRGPLDLERPVTWPEKLSMTRHYWVPGS